MDKREYIERTSSFSDPLQLYFKRAKRNFIVQWGALTQVIYMNRGNGQNKTKIAVMDEKQRKVKGWKLEWLKKIEGDRKKKNPVTLFNSKKPEMEERVLKREKRKGTETENVWKRWKQWKDKRQKHRQTVWCGWFQFRLLEEDHHVNGKESF